MPRSINSFEGQVRLICEASASLNRKFSEIRRSPKLLVPRTGRRASQNRVKVGSWGLNTCWAHALQCAARDCQPYDFGAFMRRLSPLLFSDFDSPALLSVFLRFAFEAALSDLSPITHHILNRESISQCLTSKHRSSPSMLPSAYTSLQA